MIGRWFKAASIRALKTAAQTAVGFIGVGTVFFHEVNWFGAGMVALLAGVLSILTSLTGLPEVEHGADIGKLAEWDDDNNRGTYYS
jgi:hypothetical protein